MKCRHARRALRLRLDESLGLELELRLDAHLADCERCRAFAARTQVLEEALVRLPEPPVKRLDIERAVSAVRARLEQPVREARLRRHAPRVAAAAVLVAAASAVLWSSLDGGEPARPLDERHDRATPAVAVRPRPAPPVRIENPTPSAPDLTPPPPPHLPLDTERLAAARAEVREHLGALGAALTLETDAEELEALAQLFDLDTLGLRRADWPVRRIVEGSLDAQDLLVARAAVRYLGVRGDSSSARHLRAVLESEALAASAVRALVDLGDDGVDGLARALELPATREVALAGLVSLGDTSAVECLAAAYERGPARSEGNDGPRDEALLAALLEIGTPALPALVELQAHGVLEPGAYTDALASLAGAAGWFEDGLEVGDFEHTEAFLLGACSAVPEAAAAWLETNLHERRYRSLARALLPTIEGRAAVDSLIRLNDDSRLSSDDLGAMTSIALRLDAERFAALAAEHGPRSVREREALLELLLAVGELREALPALMVSVLDNELPQSARIEAALRVGESDASEALPVLGEVFARCTGSERHLAAACLLGITRIGGAEALTAALDGGPRRAQRNILSLLHRRTSNERTTPSIYKLARELKPFLSARDRETRRSSS